MLPVWISPDRASVREKPVLHSRINVASGTIFQRTSYSRAWTQERKFTITRYGCISLNIRSWRAEKGCIWVTIWFCLSFHYSSVNVVLIRFFVDDHHSRLGRIKTYWLNVWCASLPLLLIVELSYIAQSALQTPLR